MSEQEWEDAEFCQLYESTWEISHSEVHYGWLSHGESTLQLIKKEISSSCNVLDVGCGLGQNLVALAGQGAIGYGLDISDCMLQKATQVVKDANLERQVTLQQGDMRRFSAFSDIDFDVILSVYSMEYLAGVQELRTVIHNLHKRLKPGGVFVMCFSHPSQARRYPELMNKSVPQGAGKYRTYNYSIKDATEALFKAGFSIERVVEQQTENPSQITYQEAKKYPYHFREGRSPFIKKYDEISNHSPHTIIYKARRHRDPVHGFPKQHKLSIGFRELWGYKRKVIRYKSIPHLGLTFEAIHLAPMDNVLGLLDVLSFHVVTDDLEHAPKFVEIETYDESVTIPGNSLLAFIHKRMEAYGLGPVYRLYSVNSGDTGRRERRVLIQSITGLEDEVAREFKSQKLGILVFVNGREPSMGELPMDVIEAKPGDYVQVVYVALMDDSVTKKSNQFGLFE